MIERIREAFASIPPERRKILLAAGVGLLVVVLAIRFLSRRPGANQTLTAGASDVQSVNDALSQLGNTIANSPLPVPTASPVASPGAPASSGPISAPSSGPVYYAPVASSTAASSAPAQVAAERRAPGSGIKPISAPAPRLSGGGIAAAAARAASNVRSLRTVTSAPAPAPAPRLSGGGIAAAAAAQANAAHLSVAHLRAEADAARYGY